VRNAAQGNGTRKITERRKIAKKLWQGVAPAR
jgi:hypothetical protein